MYKSNEKMTAIKHYFGIDVSKSKLDLCWLRERDGGRVKTKVFPNTEVGCKSLWQWMRTQSGCSANDAIVVLEATGVYHERIAYLLHKIGTEVRLVQPQHFYHFAASFGVRSKTDRRDSILLARYGEQGHGRVWVPESAEIRLLKALLSRLEALDQDIRREENRLEKAVISEVSQVVHDSIIAMLKVLRQERQRVEDQIDCHIDQHPTLKRDQALLKSIPGIGSVVSRYILSVLYSRDFRQADSCAAYLGLVPVVKESGSSVRGRSTLSKAGSGVVRAKLYMSAIVAIKYNRQAAALYKRLLKKGKAKMCALGAVMRKLVHMCFGVLKHQQEYSPHA